MSLSLGARPWIYLGLGPLVGLLCMMIYSTIDENIAEFGSFSELRELLLGLPIFLPFGYILGALPSFFTGLVMDLISGILRNHFSEKKLRMAVAALVGFLVSLSLSVFFMVSTNEMDELYDTHPLSVVAFSVYGAIAALVCEHLYFKLGSPKKLE